MIAYLLNLAILTAIFAMLATSLNILIGYGGIFSTAQAAFFGIGAYAAAQVSLHVTSDLLVTSAAGATVAGLLSVCLALPALRVRDEYFVIASLGLQMLAVTVFTEATPFTGGFGGLVGIPPATLLGFPLTSDTAILAACLGFLVLVLLLTWTMARGSFGRSLMAIRDNESAAQALGKNVMVLKTLAVMLGCGYAGIGGALYSAQMQFINVESFTLDQSVLIMAMVIIGGSGTLVGPLVGTVLILMLPAALSFIPGIPPTDIGVVQQMIYGLVMTLLMIYLPGGLVTLRVRRR
jgi:branched-chain amino acid transport system permease protein